MLRLQRIEAVEDEWRHVARKRLDEQTRPRGSLGQLEEWIVRFVAIQQKLSPVVRKKRIMIFAADHGVEAEGVSAYPRSVTRAMVMNFLNGGATINVLARHISAEVQVIDVGVDGDIEEQENFINAKIRCGTRNIRRESAMTVQELDRALTVGWQLVHEAKEDEVDLIGLGEMGIANTTSASAVIAACLNVAAEMVTGRGTGINDETLQRKAQVIEEALRFHRDALANPFQIIQNLGGYEIAALTGAILAGAALRLPVVVDGWVVMAAVMIAHKLNPRALDYLFFAHESAEKGHRLVLDVLQAKPMLHLSMRLGEASGAALAMGILEGGVRVYNEVATFEEAQVANREATQNPTS